MQCASSGCKPPQPKGLCVSKRVESKVTGVLFVKVPHAFASSERWQAFSKSPKLAIATWATSHHVQLTDSWNWAEEQTANGAKQVFGVLRAPLSDLPTLLAKSGEAGVFVVPPAGQREKVVVEWVDRHSKESDKDYFARASRVQTLGLAVHGTKLGWKRPITPETRFPRVWQLNGCPKSWDFVQASAVVEDHFQDVRMIRQHTRGADKAFLFRGAANAGAECDLLPIATQDGDGSQLMLWASLAPAKAEQVKQKRIKTGSLPFVTPTPDIFTPVVHSLPVQACQEAAAVDAPMPGDASPSDETSARDTPKPVVASGDAAAKRQKVTVREVPKGCTLQAAAKDGNCMYHAIGDALRWLKDQPKAFHHLDLRARVAEHLARHKEDYKPAWASDGRPGPDGTALPDWDAFVAQVALPGKYSGEAELKALCRLFSIRVIVIPGDPNWKVCSYGKPKYKAVVAIYFADRHFDFVKPEGKYSKEILSVVDDPNGGFLVGGVSEACSASLSEGTAGGAGLSQAQTSVSSRTRPRGRGMSAARTGSARTAAVRKPASVRKSHLKSSARVSQEANQELEALLEECTAEPRRRTGRPTLVQWVQAGYARCSLCPFKYKTADAKAAQVKLAAHFRYHHQGCKPAGLGPNNRMPSLVCDLSHDQAAEWRCAFCSKGISFEAARSAGKRRIASNKLQHKRECHPHVSWKKWKGADYSTRAGSATETRFKGFSQLCSRTRSHLLERFQLFRWLSWIGKAGEKLQVSPIKFCPSWVCKACHAPCKYIADAEQHLKDRCARRPPPGRLKALVTKRLSNLAKDRARFVASRVVGAQRTRGLELFAVAKEVLGRPVSPCF